MSISPAQKEFAFRQLETADRALSILSEHGRNLNCHARDAIDRAREEIARAETAIANQTIAN